MSGRRRATGQVGRVLGAALAALSLVHTPLPEPDFHNIRHHDAPGEVCDHHDHLLRWHPGAAGARDVAVLHWHWFLPTGDGSDPAPEGSGLALHAHSTDWSATAWPVPPELSAAAPRPDLRPAPAPHGSPLALFPLAGPAAPVVRPPAAPRGAPLAPGAPLLPLLHRWVC